MRCVILAAGHGSRLRTVSDSKPLTPVAGRALLEHIVEAAAAAGAREFTIVTGHEAERVEAFAATLPVRLGIAARTVRTPDWHLPNGHSLLSAAAVMEGDYLLLMGDHLFDPALAARLLKAGPGPGLRLAVDRDLSSELLDLADATKVEVGPSGEIVRIGKALTSFNAIDTGLFAASPALAAAIRDDIAGGGGGSLSEGVQRLAADGRAVTLEASGEKWIDVDDPRALALAERLVGAAAARGNAAGRACSCRFAAR